MIGCTSQRMWRQMCEKHARRLLAFEPLADPPRPEPPATVATTCPECGKVWDRQRGQTARYCSDSCRVDRARRAAPTSPNTARDAKIREAVAGGALMREVGADHGISPDRVWQIVHGWRA